MKIRLPVLIGAIIVLALCVIIWLHKPKTSMSTEQFSDTLANSNIPVAAASLPAFQAVTNAPNTGNSNNPTDIETRYRQGLIGKDQVIQETYLERNKQSQDFYGKIIDQYGKPVVSVNVNANLILNDGIFGGINVQKYSTATDNNGFFEFTGIHGADLNVLVSKDGYKIGERGEGRKGPIGEKTSPTDRAVFTMWKLRGAEPLVSRSVEFTIPYDGTPTSLDITTAEKSLTGDLQITLLRSPLQVRRSGQKFDWAVKVEMLHGGLVTENEPYPYWAPESGYEPSFEATISSNNVPWRSTLTQNFYIKGSRGQYGRMQVNFSAGLTPARIKFNLWMNPSGSQNLEFDPAKLAQ